MVLPAHEAAELRETFCGVLRDSLHPDDRPQDGPSIGACRIVVVDFDNPVYGGTSPIDLTDIERARVGLLVANALATCPGYDPAENPRFWKTLFVCDETQSDREQWHLPAVLDPLPPLCSGVFSRLELDTSRIPTRPNGASLKRAWLGFFASPPPPAYERAMRRIRPHLVGRLPPLIHVQLRPPYQLSYADASARDRALLRRLVTRLSDSLAATACSETDRVFGRVSLVGLRCGSGVPEPASGFVEMRDFVCVGNSSHGCRVHRHRQLWLRRQVTAVTFRPRPEWETSSNGRGAQVLCSSVPCWSTLERFTLDLTTPSDEVAMGAWLAYALRHPQSTICSVSIIQGSHCVRSPQWIDFDMAFGRAMESPCPLAEVAMTAMDAFEDNATGDEDHDPVGLRRFRRRQQWVHYPIGSTVTLAPYAVIFHDRPNPEATTGADVTMVVEQPRSSGSDGSSSSSPSTSSSTPSPTCTNRFEVIGHCREWTALVLPGVGLCWVASGAVVADSLVLSSGGREHATLQSVHLRMPLPNLFRNLVEMTGGNAIAYLHWDWSHRIDLSTILASSSLSGNLRTLIVTCVEELDLGVIVRGYEQQRCPLRVLIIDGVQVLSGLGVLLQALATPTHPAAEHLQMLRLPRLPRTPTAELDACLAMLAANKTLRVLYVSANVAWSRFFDYKEHFRRFHGEPIATTDPARTTAAWLSLVRATAPVGHPLALLDGLVVARVLGFVGSTIPRVVALALG